LPIVRQSKVATTCRLIRGDESTGRFKRTVIRTDVDHIGFPAVYLCPSGTIVTEGSSTCTPITTMQQATLVMKASGKWGGHGSDTQCLAGSPIFASSLTSRLLAQCSSVHGPSLPTQGAKSLNRSTS
jgi:hypothetical protein